MRNKGNSVIINHDFDDQTIRELNTLRGVRLELAIAQLENIDETIDKLVERGLVPNDQREKYTQELIEELEQKIQILLERDPDSSDFHLDEISLYVDLL